MSKSEVCAPVSSAASDRLALGVGWVRPGAGGIGSDLTPSYCTQYGSFAGTEE